MSIDERFARLGRAEREALCREVLEQLSAYVEGDAPTDFRRKVDDLLAGCQPFEAYCNTLRATIELAGACPEPPGGFEEAYARSVERVRRRRRADAD